MRVSPSRPRNDGTRLYYYSCNNRSKDRIAKQRGKKKCTAKPIRTDILDPDVWKEIKMWVAMPKAYLDKYYRDLDKEALASLQKEYTDTQEQLARAKGESEGCYDLIGHPSWPKEKLNLRKEKADKKVEVLERKLSEIEAKVNAVPNKEVFEQWDEEMNDSEKRTIVWDAMDNLTTTEKRELMGWFFPNDVKDNLGKPYGVYVRPKLKFDDYDEIPDEKSPEDYEEITGEYVIHLNGVFNSENIGRLIDKIRSKIQYSDCCDNATEGHRDYEFNEGKSPLMDFLNRVTGCFHGNFVRVPMKE